MNRLLKTCRSLVKANLIGIMLVCAALAIAIVAGLVVALMWLTAHLVNLNAGWQNTLLTWSVGLLSGIGGWFMLPALTVLLAGLFQDIVMERVERLDYPHCTRRVERAFWPEFWYDVRFTGWAVLLNLAVLPCYVFGIGFALSILLNSYLVGREFFDIAAGFHLGKMNAQTLRQKHRQTVYGGGLVITCLTLIPLINLLVPLFALVWMIHVYHAIFAAEDHAYLPQ